MSNLTLSVIIPALDEEHVLDLLLTDICNQSDPPPFEIIVADGDSTDNTRAIAESHKARVVRGGTASAGRNNGAKAAKADVLLFLDADTRLPPGFIKDCYDEFSRRGLHIAAVDNTPMGATRPRLYSALYFVHNTFVRMMVRLDPHMTSTCFMARSNVYERLGGFDESVPVFSDSEFVKRAVKAGFRYGILDSVSILASVRRLEARGPIRWSAILVLALLRRRFAGETTVGSFYWGGKP